MMPTLKSDSPEYKRLVERGMIDDRNAPKPRQTHKSELEQIRKLARRLGGECQVMHQAGKVRGSAGTPDLRLQFPDDGVAVWFEVKVGRDRLSYPQKEFIQIEALCGQTVLVGGVEELMEWWRQT